MEAINDHKAISDRLRLASGLKQTPPQNDHSAPYVAPVDYGMYACFESGMDAPKALARAREIADRLLDGSS